MSSHPPSHPRHGLESSPLRIALVVARGASSTEGSRSAVAEIGRRLVDQGQSVTVLGAEALPWASEGGSACGSLAPMRRIALWSRLLLGPCQDVVLLLDPADAPLAPLLKSRGSAVVVRVEDPDHLGARHRRAWPSLVGDPALRGVDALVTDLRIVQDRYRDELAVPVELIRPGTRIVTDAPADVLESLGAVAGGFHLAVTHPGPDDRTDVVLEGFHRSNAHLPLIVVGRATGSANVQQLAARDPRIRLLGDVRDQRLLDQLHAHAVSSVHGRDAGTIDTSLLRTMGAATAVIAWKSVANREAAGTAGSYFSSAAELTREVEEVERYPFRFRDIGELMQERARRFHDWDVAAEQYSALASKLARGHRPSPPRLPRRLDRATSPAPVEVRRV